MEHVLIHAKRNRLYHMLSWCVVQCCRSGCVAGMFCRQRTATRSRGRAEHAPVRCLALRRAWRGRDFEREFQREFEREFERV